LTWLPSLTWLAEPSAAACLGTGVAAVVAARSATGLAADLPSAGVAAAVSPACSASPSPGAGAAACAETSQRFSAGNAAHFGEGYIASIYCGLACSIPANDATTRHNVHGGLQRQRLQQDPKAMHTGGATM